MTIKSFPNPAVTSRIYINNLSKHATVEQIREYFSSQGGNITDVHLAKNQNGQSRRFAYVGFENEEQAKKAVSYFDNTYLGTCKINVTFAEAKKRSTDTLKNREAQNISHEALLERELTEKKKKLMSIYADKYDPKLRSYLESMKPVSKKRTWANDDDISFQTENNLETEHKPQILVTAVSSKKSNIKKTKSHIRFTDTNNTSTTNEEILNEPLSDKDDSIRLNIDETRTIILETGRLFLRGLTYSCTEQDLESLLSKFGPLDQVHISRDLDTKKSKGFGYASFLMPEHALKAYRELDETAFQGRLLHILPAQERPLYNPQTSQSYKSKKDALKRENAMKSTESWNMMYMSRDAIMDCISHQLGIPKRKLLSLDHESNGDHLTSRVALAETQIIQQTKEYFENHGINLEINQLESQKRSKTIILIKNIPYSTTEDELLQLFNPFGSIQRIILPPTNTLAFVEFVLESDAKRAFANLSYKRFKSTPLYLEFPPEAILKTKPTVTFIESTQLSIVPELPAAEPSKVLFIKNLNFTTTEDALSRILTSEHFKGIIGCTIARKKGGLSCGYGFVEFESIESAQQAMKELVSKSIVLDGNRLMFQYSQPKKINDGGDNTKVIIRNIPFEAKVRDLRELIQPFAQIKSIRLPKRVDGRHRGFGFVEFISHKEACSAIEAIRHTHLLGRHLVCEWEAGEEDETLNALRKKTVAQMERLQQEYKNDAMINQVDEDEEY